MFYGGEKEIITAISQDIWHIGFFFLQTFQITIILHYETHQPKTVQPTIVERMANLKSMSVVRRL